MNQSSVYMNNLKTHPTVQGFPFTYIPSPHQQARPRKPYSAKPIDCNPHVERNGGIKILVGEW